jgi:hypothetical protein
VEDQVAADGNDARKREQAVDKKLVTADERACVGVFQFVLPSSAVEERSTTGNDSENASIGVRLNLATV